MSTTKFATAVVYTDDVPRSVEFYVRATGIEPSLYDRDLGFALLGTDQSVAIASHAAGALMLADGYDTMKSAQVRGAELAFWAADVSAAFQRALDAGALALTPPRLMPWGQTVAYVQAPEGTIVGFLTPVAA
ncbi:VOC family protein [Synechococcus sp. FACHB-909]|uniref:VOC family protein n=1 Tax=Synechococcus sp. FACHB-909 TaxID=2692863 RepID=UPI0016885EA9|nr:VOC family protein [Synechococcus sp. FACHB-909]MBD2720002.1 VOC family protein [Synechococcus sp. FACHB-909]